jgi:hypothetical protein
MLTHEVRGGCWWYDSKGWTFQPVVCKFCCRATGSSRGAVWQNGVWHGSAWGAEVCHWIPPCGKPCTRWHSWTSAERLRRPNSWRWVVRLSSGDSDLRDRPRDPAQLSAVLDFLEPGETISSDRYIPTLTKLKTRISKVRPEKKTTFALEHDIARPRTSLKTVEHVAKFGWTVLPHPP